MSKALVYVAGHRGLAGSAVARAIDAEGEREWVGRTHAELDLLDRRRGLRVRRGDEAGCGGRRRRQGRRHRGELRVPGGVPHREPPDPVEPHRRRARRRRAAPGLPRLARASTRSSPRSRSTRTRCSPGRSSRPTTRTRSRRSPASASSTPTAASTAGTGSPRCRPTSTGPATTSTSRPRTCSPRSCTGSTTPKVGGRPVGDRLGRRESPLREFLHVDDLADGPVCTCSTATTSPARSTSASARTCRSASSPSWSPTSSGSTGEIVWDTTHPDGTPRKILDSSRIRALGWHPRIDLARASSAPTRGTSAVRRRRRSLTPSVPTLGCPMYAAVRRSLSLHVGVRAGDLLRAGHRPRPHRRPRRRRHRSDRAPGEHRRDSQSTGDGKPRHACSASSSPR